MSSTSPAAPGAADVAKDLPQILLVDDEPGIVAALQRHLGNEPYAITAVTDPQRAAQACQEREFALVVSDNAMPGLTGLDLLARIKAQQPLTRRLLLTGGTDLNQAIKAFNDGTIHRFINKPWNKAELLSAVNYEVELYFSQRQERDQRTELEQVLKARTNQLLDTAQALKQAQTQVTLFEDAASLEKLNLPGRLRRLSVLVVDENAQVRDLTVDLLKRAGIANCAGAAGSSEALAMLQSRPAVDVVVSEWKLGGMDGLGLLQALRQGQSPSRQAFFILFTARENRVLVDHALKQGVDGYLIKPFRLKALLDQFDQALLKDQQAEQKRRELIRGRTFLVANADPASRDQIHHLLASCGVRELTLASSGALALRLTEERLPDVLIYDCNLKDPYWKDLRPALSRAGTALQPALVVTSVMPVQAELEEIRRENLTTFLPGPFRQIDLLQVIVRALEQRGR